MDKMVPKIGSLVILLLIAIGGFSSFYTVDPEERAVVIRLGKYLDTFGPGLHFRLPFGIDRVEVVQTEKPHQEEFGYRSTGQRGSRTNFSGRSYDTESLMLTGDLNVADVEWAVHYKISDPFKYLFRAKDPRKNIRDVSEAVIRRVVGDKFVSDVLTTGRAQIAAEVLELTQKTLDKYDSGVKIENVFLQDVNPPDMVKPSFNEVNEAKQEQEKVINQAEENYNRVIPEAAGTAKKTIAQARGYAAAIINRAEGDANKFSAILKTYKKAPLITKKRIYLETMEDLFKKFEKLTIVDSKVQGLLPVFKQQRLIESQK